MWGLGRRRPLSSAQRVLRTSLLSLALGGGMTLALHGPGSAGMTTASVTTLDAWRCTRWVLNQGCAGLITATFPNPSLWGILAVFVTAGGGLRRPSRISSTRAGASVGAGLDPGSTAGPWHQAACLPQREANSSERSCKPRLSRSDPHRRCSGCPEDLTLSGNRPPRKAPRSTAAPQGWQGRRR